jgi:hypothetical protein
MGGPSKCVHLLVDIARAQDDDDEEWYADIDSEEGLEDTTFQDPSSEENDEDLEWHHRLPSDKSVVHQFMGEQNGLSKTAAPNISENSQHYIFFSVFRLSWQ